MSDIFYSQVNNHLAKELYARANAGYGSRSTKDLNYMLGKIANVSLVAFESGFDGEILETIGHKNTQQGKYLPSGPEGFLNTSTSNRIGPVITGVTVKLADNAQFAINTATVTIVVPDLDDLDRIEEVFFKPGRMMRLLVEHPEDVILGENQKLNESELLATTRIIKDQGIQDPEEYL